MLRTFLAPTLRAARENWLPALIIQIGIIAVAAGYYLSPQCAEWMGKLAKLKDETGLVFTLLATGLAAGIGGELVRIYLVKRGQWEPGDVTTLVFRFLFFGLNGCVVDLFYRGQAVLFGNALAPDVLVKKVLVDQFVFSPIWAAPLQASVFYWREQNFSGAKLVEFWKDQFYLKRVVPLLFSTWIFWIPMMAAIYSLPLNLQVALFVLASLIWGIFIISLTRSSEEIKN